MLHKSLLGLPVVLLGASCVPPVAAGQGSVTLASVAAPRTAEAPPAKVLLPLPAPEAIAPGHAAAPFDIGDHGEKDVLASLDCLTAAVYYEARSEGTEGQRAVAQVVLNRVRHPAFPNSVCGVVYQGSQRSTGCQFSFTCDGSTRARREPEAWAKARRIAAAALAGSVFGPVGLATHYHTTAIHPWWADSLTRAVTIGSHVFYRWRGEWGDPKSFRRPYVGAEYARRDDEPAATAPAARDRFGVSVHRGGTEEAYAATEAVGEVRIHRGSDAPQVAVRIHAGTPQSAALEPASEPAEAIVAVR
ncbi:MAG: cell wall hydrolase [Allosphingosinicella sp.]